MHRIWSITRGAARRAAASALAAGSPLYYAAAGVFVFLTFPVTVAARLITVPFDRNRMVTSRALRFLGEVLVRLVPLWKIDIQGRLPPRPNTFVVVPNHQSMVDALAIACLPREMKWIAKRSVFRVPWFGWALRLAGHVPVLRGDRPSGSRALRRLRSYLERGVPVGLFAEGTRTRDGSLQPFKAGPFKLAIEAGVPVIPVAISGADRAMPADKPWIHRSRIRVRILAAVETRGLSVANVDELREEVRRRIAACLEELRPLET